MKVKIGLIAFIILGVSYSLFLIFIKDKPATISQKEAEAIVTDFYGGKVIKTKLEPENDSYQVKFENKKGVYQVSVDSETKKISNIRLVDKKEDLIALDEAKKNIEKQLGVQVIQLKELEKEGQPFVEATIEKDDKQFRIEYDLNEKTIVSNTEMVGSESNPLNISEQKAKDIALQQINGHITDLSVVKNQSGMHYKVTVDDYSEGAYVYVQADTGKVSTISWYAEQPDDDDSMNEEDDHEDDESDD